MFVVEVLDACQLPPQMWHSLVLVQSGVEHSQHRGVGGDEPGKSQTSSHHFFLAPHVAGPDQEFADGVTECGHAMLMGNPFARFHNGQSCIQVQGATRRGHIGFDWSSSWLLCRHRVP